MLANHLESIESVTREIAQSQLATTGADGIGIMVVAIVIILVAGVGLLLLRRRRTSGAPTPDAPTSQSEAEREAASARPDAGADTVPGDDGSIANDDVDPNAPLR